MIDRGRLKRFLPRWLLLVAWGVGILVLSLKSAPPHLTLPLLGWDKLQHAFAYLLLTLFAGLAFDSFGWDKKHKWLYSMVVAVSFGAVIEILQGTVTTERNFDLFDILANIMGSGTVVVIAMLIKKSRKS
jgi:VanZ family protein